MTQESKIILVRNQEYGRYFRTDSFSGDGGLIFLWLFLTTCPRYDTTRFSLMHRLLSEGSIGCNDVGAQHIDGKFQFSHDLIDGLDDLQLTAEELFELIVKWYRAVSAKAEKIIIINMNGRFSIETMPELKPGLVKTILVRDSQGCYAREEFHDHPGDELLILEDYFRLSIGRNPARILLAKQSIENNSLTYGPIGVEINEPPSKLSFFIPLLNVEIGWLRERSINGKIRLYHKNIPNLKGLFLTKEELLTLVDRWFELVSSGAEKIVITNDNGKFSIGAE